MPLQVALCAGINSIRTMQQRPLASSQGFLQHRLLLPAGLRWTNERLPLPLGAAVDLASSPCAKSALQISSGGGEVLRTCVEWSNARQKRRRKCTDARRSGEDRSEIRNSCCVCLCAELIFARKLPH